MRAAGPGAPRLARPRRCRFDDCRNIELDGLTAYGGQSAIQVHDTQRPADAARACRGIGAPWTFRGRLKYRSVEARIFSASGWDPTGADNRDFELGYCEFTDCVDGVFLGNVRGVRFHHNLVDNVTDDGVFLTAGTAYDGDTRGGDVHIYQNRFVRILTTFAFGVGHGRQKTTRPTGRQADRQRRLHLSQRLRFPPARLVHLARRPRCSAGDHLARPLRQRPRRPRLGADADLSQHDPRRRHAALRLRLRRLDSRHCTAALRGACINNIVCLTQGTPGNTIPPPEADFQGNDNLFWSLAPEKPLPGNLFAKFQASPAFEKSKQKYRARLDGKRQDSGSVPDVTLGRLPAAGRSEADRKDAEFAGLL